VCPEGSPPVLRHGIPQLRRFFALSTPVKPRSVWARQVVVRDPGGPSIALREWRAPDGPYFTDWYPEPESTPAERTGVSEVGYGGEVD
jgi:hypothetical protein